MSRTKKKKSFDTTIRVSRSIRPVYPDWVDKVMHPELENTGPSEYDLGKVELWLHNKQKKGGVVKGKSIYQYLKKNDMLKTCLGLADGEEIQKKSIVVFQKLFGNKSVFLWKSVVCARDGRVVPYLGEHGSRVVVFWRWLYVGWDGVDPAARLASI